MTSLQVGEAGPVEAEALLGVVHRAFAARPRLDPPSTATDETARSVAAALAGAGGLLVRRDGVPVGGLLFDTSRPGMLGLRRVAVDPAHQGHGVASAMVGVAEDVAERRGLDGVWVTVREELPATEVFWLRRGYVETARTGPLRELSKALWVALPAGTAEQTRAAGERLARLARPGDLVVLTGALGAGKTTLVQGLGRGLQVRGAVTSPTFVIARVHPSTGTGPDLVHVDAYRLGGGTELDDLDLDASLDESVTVVEWGEGLAESLADSYLEVSLETAADRGQAALAAAGPHRGGARSREKPAAPAAAAEDSAAGPRVLSVRPHGPRWATAPLRSTLLGD